MDDTTPPLEIFPSILENDPKSVAAFIKKTYKLFQHFQIDIADGMLVDGLTFSVEEWVAYLLQNESSIPETVSAEFHLMVQDFLPRIQTLATIRDHMKIPTILLHFEALQSLYKGDTLDFYPALAHDCPGFEYGIVISEKTSVQENLECITAFPIVQIMTVEAGSQGRPFLPNSLKHIKTLREASYYGKIQLDGGINATSLPEILNNKYLPNAVCPGSFLKEDTKEHLDELHTLISTASSH